MENGPILSEKDTQTLTNSEVVTNEVVDSYEENYLPESLFPEKCRPMLDLIKGNYRKVSEEFKQDHSKIPDINEIIKETLSEYISASGKVVDVSAGDGDLTPAGFYEWIPKELYREIVADLSGVEVEDEFIQNKIKGQLTVLRDYQERNLRSHIEIFSKSKYFSHVTNNLIDLLKRGSILSRSEQEKKFGRSNFNTGSDQKADDQEKDQICFHIDQMSLRYGSLGSTGSGDWNSEFIYEPRTSAVLLIPTLPILAREDVSFFSGDGLHVFMKNGFEIPLNETVIIPSERGLKNIRSTERLIRKTNPFKGKDKIIDNTILSDEQKQTLERQMIVDSEGQELTMPQESFEDNLVPEYIDPIISSKVGEKSDSLRVKFKESARFVPTGEFGDGPSGSKIFVRKIVFV